jgi:outer membrane protein assembly factor BamB
MVSVVLGCAKPVETVKPANTKIATELPAVTIAADDWPWWRGPTRNNHAVGPLPPVRWSQTENILWKAKIPGRGHATPSVSSNRVYVATADEDAETQSLLCYDRENGKLHWTCEVHKQGFMHAHSKNSQASATPACDGERIFVAFISHGHLWVTAIDLAGKIVWQTQAGTFNSQHGYGSSPLINQSLVIVAGDNQGAGFITALHRKTGEIVWRTPRDNDPSYGTPIIASTGGREQLLLSGQNSVQSYDPLTGERLWMTSGPADVTANTVAWNENAIFASGGYPQNGVLAIRAKDGGEILWQQSYKVYVTSPLVVGDRLFIVQDNGVARCLDAESGNEVWTQRLGGDFSASPVLCGDVIFVPSESGAMHLFKASDEYEKVAENQLGDRGFASPVICGGRIYLRSGDTLYCIGQHETE